MQRLRCSSLYREKILLGCARKSDSRTLRPQPAKTNESRSGQPAALLIRLSTPKPHLGEFLKVVLHVVPNSRNKPHVLVILLRGLLLSSAK